MENIEVIFFDLFFTLVRPDYPCGRSENDVLGMTRSEWEKFAEDEEIYLKRASGRTTDAHEIIDDILDRIPAVVDREQRGEILQLREQRMKSAMINVDPKVLETIRTLKSMGKRLCLLSNADVIDAMYWQESALAGCFEDAVFSYEVGCLKPSREIYIFAMNKMNVTADHCLFIGDGGSGELEGAKKAGIKTLLTEYLKKNGSNRAEILKYADWFVSDFSEIAKIMSSK